MFVDNGGGGLTDRLTSGWKWIRRWGERLLPTTSSQPNSAAGGGTWFLAFRFLIFTVRCYA